MRSSLYRSPTIPVNANGQPLPGYIVLIELAGPIYVLHAAPGAPILAGMTAVDTGRDWTWLGLKARLPAATANTILHAEYTDGTMANGQLVRKRAPRSKVPAGATIIAADLPPHFWAGDE